MIAIGLGAREPRWINGVWWHDREHYPLAGVRSAADVARIAVPDWNRLEIVQRMLESRAAWGRAHPDEPLTGFGLTWPLTIPGRGSACGVFYPSFVDLGVYLMGMTRFLGLPAGEPDVADALRDLCFELSTSYTEFLLAVHPEPFEALGGFGGDATALLSPGLYERYSAAWDARLFDFARAEHDLPDDVPCNLHSCGASSHLYDLWGAHPRAGNITTVQTRLIPGRVKPLRENLPGAQLEVTLHPPEFDVVAATPEQVGALLRAAAGEAGFRDIHFAVIAAVHSTDAVPRLERNLAVLAQTMEEIRADAAGVVER